MIRLQETQLALDCQRAFLPWTRSDRLPEPDPRGSARVRARAIRPARARRPANRVVRVSRRSGQHPVGDRGQLAADARGVQRGQAAVHARCRERTRFRHAVERGVGGLASSGVLAGGFAETGRCALDVENVVDDLKGQAELSGERLDRPELIARSLRP